MNSTVKRTKVKTQNVYIVSRNDTFDSVVCLNAKERDQAIAFYEGKLVSVLFERCGNKWAEVD